MQDTSFEPIDFEVVIYWRDEQTERFNIGAYELVEKFTSIGGQEFFFQIHNLHKIFLQITEPDSQKILLQKRADRLSEIVGLIRLRDLEILIQP